MPAISLFTVSTDKVALIISGLRHGRKIGKLYQCGGLLSLIATFLPFCNFARQWKLAINGAYFLLIVVVRLWQAMFLWPCSHAHVQRTSGISNQPFFHLLWEINALGH